MTLLFLDRNEYFKNNTITKVSSVTELTSIGSCISSHEDLDNEPNTPESK